MGITTRRTFIRLASLAPLAAATLSRAFAPMARKDNDPFVEVEKALAGLREGIAALR